MNPVIFIFAGALLALSFCGFLIRWIFKQPQGSEKMQTISRYIFEGSKGYLKQQYKIVSIFFLIVFCILLFMAFKGFLVIFVPFAFITGGLFFRLLWLDRNVCGNQVKCSNCFCR